MRIFLVVVTCFSLFLTSTDVNAVNIFRKVKETLTGSGVGEITDLGNNKFEITVAAPVSMNKQDTVVKWDRTAQKACNGKYFDTISRGFNNNDGLLMEGTIVCKSKAPSQTQANSSSNKNSASQSDVLTVQRQLNKLGYGTLTEDGRFGESTRNALISFQNDNNLSPTGTINDQTNETLLSREQGLQVASNQETSVAVADSTPQMNMVSRLRDFDKLRKDGIISEEEFILLKQKVIEEYLE